MRRFPRMLVADDDENDLRMIARALPENEPAYPVTFVHDGGEALDFLQGRGPYAENPPEPPGVLLLDLHMPRCNGWDVLRAVRADERLRGLPIVIFSSSDRDHDIRLSYELGATAYVMKPVDAATFRQTVAKIHAFWIGCNRLTGSMPPTLPPVSPSRPALHTSRPSLPSRPSTPSRPPLPSRPSGRHKTATS